MLRYESVGLGYKRPQKLAENEMQVGTVIKLKFSQNIFRDFAGRDSTR